MSNKNYEDSHVMMYVRDKSNKPFGLVIALGENQFGYSICHRLDKNNWDKEKAKLKSFCRANTSKDRSFNFWLDHFAYKIAESRSEKNSVYKSDVEHIKTRLLWEINNPCKAKTKLKAVKVLSVMKRLEKVSSAYFSEK